MFCHVLHSVDCTVPPLRLCASWRQPTAKEVFLEMLVDYLLEVAGGAGAIVPWQNVKQDLFLDKVTLNTRLHEERKLVQQFSICRCLCDGVYCMMAACKFCARIR